MPRSFLAAPEVLDEAELVKFERANGDKHDLSTSEEAEAYRAIVAVLNPRWRVIECRNGIQWILQRNTGLRHGTTRWEGRCYCRTRECLLRRVRELAGEIEPTASAVLNNLPDWIGGQP